MVDPAQVMNSSVEQLEAKIPKYFDRDYVQHVDGKTIGYDEFVEHMKVLHGKIKDVSVRWKELHAYAFANDGKRETHIFSPPRRELHRPQGRVPRRRRGLRPLQVRHGPDLRVQRDDDGDARFVGRHRLGDGVRRGRPRDPARPPTHL